MDCVLCASVLWGTLPCEQAQNDAAEYAVRQPTKLYTLALQVVLGRTCALEIRDAAVLPSKRETCSATEQKCLDAFCKHKKLPSALVKRIQGTYQVVLPPMSFAVWKRSIAALMPGASSVRETQASFAQKHSACDVSDAWFHGVRVTNDQELQRYLQAYSVDALGQQQRAELLASDTRGCYGRLMMCGAFSDTLLMHLSHLTRLDICNVALPIKFKADLPCLEVLSIKNTRCGHLTVSSSNTLAKLALARMCESLPVSCYLASTHLCFRGDCSKHELSRDVQAALLTYESFDDDFVTLQLVPAKRHASLHVCYAAFSQKRQAVAQTEAEAELNNRVARALRALRVKR